jgi:protein tyrosine/serine phosphatase
MKILSVILVFITLSLGAEEEGVLGDNFHEIDPGKYYRSAQLSAKSMQKYIDRHGIKTVINLRGAKDADWYREQVKVIESNGISQFDIGMSARRLPHRDDLLALLELFENVERPILVHCQGGADRTGEASALYQMLYMGKSKEESLKMLTLKYHHLAWRMPAKRYFIKDLWQGVDWAISDYRPCETDWKHYKRHEYKECENTY